jgi:hypothetical protein
MKIPPLPGKHGIAAFNPLLHKQLEKFGQQATQGAFLGYN